jgi:hypothetical protein
MRRNAWLPHALPQVTCEWRAAITAHGGSAAAATVTLKWGIRPAVERGMQALRQRGALVALLVTLCGATPGGVLAQDAGAASLGGGSNNAIAGMQGALLADPTSRQQVLSLQDDPQVKAILDDPATMRAVQSGDLGALMNDPKLRALLDNPTVRGLVDQQAR